jgi:3-hydroxyisobutyrate dehydrogenase-like beta-hydroxyacid dehydrogenase
MSERAPFPVGIVGLGAMGMPIARRLASEGFPVVGHDPRLSPQSGSDDGVLFVSSARDVARHTDATLILVGTDEQALRVVSDSDSGILAGAAPRHIVMIGSTVAPATSLAVGRACAAHDVAALDTALCRGEAPAADGTLLVMAGGDTEAFATCRPVLDAIASDVHLLGPLGAGQIAKMINNYLLWLTVVGNFEGLRLAARMGLDVDALRVALLQSSGANWALETWERARPMPWAEDDMAVVLQAADDERLPMAAAGVVRELIKAIKLEKATVPGGGGAAGSMHQLVEALERH